MTTDRDASPVDGRAEENAPDWLVVGARVVEYTQSRHMGHASIIGTEVTKIGKRDVVLANGNRFPVRSLRKTRGTWDPDTVLVHADDPRVGEVRQANLRSRRISKADAAWDAWRRSRSKDDARALVEAVEAVDGI